MNHIQQSPPSESDGHEEQPETCTATISYSGIAGGPRHRCTQPAGHYDETRKPSEQEGERDPGGWHCSIGSGHPGHWVTWSDRATNSAPHETRCSGCGHTDGEGCGCPAQPSPLFELREDETPDALRDLTAAVRELVAVLREDLEGRTEDAEATELDPTAPATECSAQRRVAFEAEPRQCIRAAHHHADHIDNQGYHWSDTVAEYPTAKMISHDGPTYAQPFEQRVPNWLSGTRDLSIPEQRPVVCDQPGPWGDSHACVRPTGHDGGHEAHDGCSWRDPAPASLDDTPDVVHPEANPQASGSPGVDDPWKTKAEETELRAKQLQELLQVANETANRSEAERDRIRQEYENLLTRWRNALTTVDRFRRLRDRWNLMTLEPGQVRRLLDEVTHVLDSPTQPAQEADGPQAYVDTALFEGYWKYLDQHIHRLRTDLAEWTPVGVLGSIEGLDDKQEDPAAPAFVWPHLHGKTALTTRLETSFTYTRSRFDEAIHVFDALYRARLDRRLARLARALGQWEEIVRRDFHAVQRVLEDAGVLDGYGRVTVPQPVRPPVLWEAP